ncbi:hypothetical protein PF010_g29601 [Phytophthora fragariae]|uniref:Secreted protein n=1 Tax=Phytophthora fragariae TaxID=53985 RepID=A0A6G0JNE3_9STRA|nr:hypothetical protein PF010_g29601 [Phytophthora fragariae]
MRRQSLPLRGLVFILSFLVSSFSPLPRPGLVFSSPRSLPSPSWFCGSYGGVTYSRCAFPASSACAKSWAFRRHSRAKCPAFQQ